MMMMARANRVPNVHLLSNLLLFLEIVLTILSDVTHWAVGSGAFIENNQLRHAKNKEEEQYRSGKLSLC